MFQQSNRLGSFKLDHSVQLLGAITETVNISGREQYNALYINSLTRLTPIMALTLAARSLWVGIKHRTACRNLLWCRT